jgi:DNA-directed RNA polymerase subunit alpha
LTQAPVTTIQAQTPEQSATYSRFTIEPLNIGWGITIGNAMRRALLSSLRGAAVTWIRVEGVEQEFSAIPDVKEDGIDFLLNVKDIRIRPVGNRPGKLFLDIEGRTGAITAGDITPSADFEIINPQLHLATIDGKNAKLHVEFNVELGTGYQREKKMEQPQLISVDAVFSPMRKVDYSVEPTRPGEEGSAERLILDVWTDGTITPEDAVSQSAALLMDQFSVFRTLTNQPAVSDASASEVRTRVPPEKYAMALESLNLSTRTYNSLRRAGISTLGELLERSMTGLPELPGFGAKSQEEVLTILEGLGLGGIVKMTAIAGSAEDQKEDSDETPDSREES